MNAVPWDADRRGSLRAGRNGLAICVGSQSAWLRGCSRTVSLSPVPVPFHARGARFLRSKFNCVLEGSKGMPTVVATPHALLARGSLQKGDRFMTIGIARYIECEIQ